MKEIIKIEEILSDSYILTKLGRIKEYSGIQVQTDQTGVYYIHQKASTQRFGYLRIERCKKILHTIKHRILKS